MHRPWIVRWVVSLPFLAVAVLGQVRADETKPSAEQLRFFETKIRPLLAQRCYECHGAQEQESELRLDTYSGLMKGGKAGAAVVAQRPQQSLLITAVGYQDADLQMPPDEKLSKGEIADLTQWIRMGAPHPEADGSTVLAASAIDMEQGRQFWAFQPPVDPPPPTVANTAWPTSVLDRFVLAKLEEHGLKPAPPADKRTLIRRATFDLTGLPPTPEEIDAFLADDSPRAFEKVVERLLASVAYGQRWGRHWLDVARYADSNGLDENKAHGNAWRYRDYVIASLNDDKPYDRFLIEQLAGDLLPPTENEQLRHQRLIATGYLALGPKVLAEVDETKMEMDIIDEQIDTLGRSMLGLTLGCARCHDHKFDPILTEDYYGLAGIFKSTRVMDNFTKVADWHEVSLPTDEYRAAQAAYETEVARQKQAIVQLIARTNRQLGAAGGVVAAADDQGQQQPTAQINNNDPSDDTSNDNTEAPAEPSEESFPAEVRDRLKKLRADLATLEMDAPHPPSAMAATEGETTDLRVHVRGQHLTQGELVPRHFPLVLAGDDQPALDDNRSGRLRLANWLVGRDHPLTSRVMVNRIWRWHFGEGIVGTPDNFGRLGQRPVNQPLLDWLARRFIQGGWSIKAMHRLMMLSSTYRMSSAFDRESAAIDPENRFGWRANVRRLEAEAIRDSLLAVSGLLDRSMGGSLLHVENREYVFNHTSKDDTDYGSYRRSVYLPVIRNHLYDMFQLFDYNDASVSNGDRSATVVAPQALYMMNGQLVAEAAESLAHDLLGSDRRSSDRRGSDHLDDAGRTELLYRKAYGRRPTDEEISRAADFIVRFEQALADEQSDAPTRRAKAWASLCQVLLASNEFIYVK